MEQNKQIIGILTNERKTPIERFWDAKQRMEEEARILVDCLAGHSRSKVQWCLPLMHRHGSGPSTFQRQDLSAVESP
jgi:predicted protein tyrosine phosphatase